MVATALLRAIVCVRLFAKTFRVPSHGIIDFRMYKYHQPWTIWTAGLSVVYVHKRESHVGVISTLGAGASTTVPGRFVGPSNCDHFCFGPFVASWAPSLPSCRKKTRKEVKDQVSERRVAMRIRAAVSMSVSYIAPCRSKGKSSCWVYVRVPNLAVRDEGEEMKWNPRKIKMYNKIDRQDSVCLSGLIPASEACSQEVNFLMLPRPLLLVLLVIRSLLLGATLIRGDHGEGIKAAARSPRSHGSDPALSGQGRRHHCGANARRHQRRCVARERESANAAPTGRRLASDRCEGRAAGLSGRGPRLILLVGLKVLLHVVGAGESPVASRPGARNRLLGSVNLCVTGSMTRGGEGLVTAIRIPEFAGITLRRGACLSLGALLARRSALDRLVLFVNVHAVVLLQR